MAMEANTAGWAAVGFGEAAGMRGADIAVMHVNNAGQASVVDYHAIGNQLPIVDGKFPFKHFLLYQLNLNC